MKKNQFTPKRIMTIPIHDVHGSATLSLTGDGDEMRQVLVVNNVYFAIPDQGVVEFNFDDDTVEIWAYKTTIVG